MNDPSSPPLNLLYFAGVADALGKRSEKRDLSFSPFTVAELVLQLQKEYPQLPLEAVRIAVNEEFCEKTRVLHPGDTVAFIPPVSGG